MRPSLFPPTLSRQSLASLVVDVTSNPLIGGFAPIEGATVLIKKRDSTGQEVVIAELTTNANGQTPVIELEVPPKELSLEPNPSTTPFSTYIVEAKKPGYETIIVYGAQLFATIRSIQSIYLTPSLITPRKTLHRQLEADIVIGPPTLYGDYPPKIPESEVKDTTAPGFIVLDKVVVPEFIIVHDGSPNNNNAPNYTVSYKDYIKNVASSEIYPTWTTETIKANVRAIVSFTLNRVYTEWYRNKGKNFTITNSTAYDHAFFYGRDIFDSISQIVDEVFDIYIQRPGVQQPLLTQYCDGERVKCPNWMSQWGSQSLGEQGKTADEILRYYYGEEVVFPTAPEVAGNPESYPGSPLKIGSSGPAVRTIQEQLNRIAKNYPLIPKVATTGNFDADTEKAVKTFQEIFHLPKDGVVGKNTWYKISEIYVAVTKIAELLPQ